MKTNPETAKKIQELQILEQNLQNIAMQKQVMQMELNEVSNALEEMDNSGDEVYKIVSSIMVKSDKEKIKKEFEEKKKVLSLRIDSSEKQEKLIEDKAKELREEAQKMINTKNN